MLIYLGADHRGYKLKERLKKFLRAQGYQIVDAGNNQYDENDDYPEFAASVAKEISNDSENKKGVLICGSGIGMDIVANKFKNCRSVLAMNPNQAYSSRRDNNANIITLAAEYLSDAEAEKILLTWLSTPFSNSERHNRRLEKISKIEENNFIASSAI